MADNTGLFGDGMMGGYGNNITAANIIRSRYRQPIAQAAMENADTGSIRATPPTPFESWLNESGQRLMNPTDTIAQGVQNFTQQDPVDMGMSLFGGGLGTIKATQTAGELAQKLAHDRAMLPVSEHGLGLPAGNSAMDRAKAMEFDLTPRYHGSDKDFQSFDPAKFGAKDQGWYGRGITTDTDPEIASAYANYHAEPTYNPEAINGQVVYPLVTRGKYMLWPENQTPFSTKKDAIQGTQDMQNLGYHGAEMTNDRDLYGDATQFGTEQVTFNPHDVRSRFAAFDPWRRNAAIAALTGTAAPDLMAGENDNLVNALRSK